MVGLAFLLIAMCTALWYLSSPHQRWLAMPLRAWPARLPGCVLVMGALWLLLRVMQPAAAVFTQLSWLMLMLIAWPCLGAIARPLGDRQPSR